MPTKQTLNDLIYSGQKFLFILNSIGAIESTINQKTLLFLIHTTIRENIIIVSHDLFCFSNRFDYFSMKTKICPDDDGIFALTYVLEIGSMRCSNKSTYLG